ncbi:MAG TPA: threonine ammonia-lyase [Acidobacteriaceae bacterium]|jgi:threonine dehydratase|nr:threonine ammonia-lyase [Acidobacteriaceae bacterium]
MGTTASPTLTLADILAARQRLNGAVYLSPCARSEMLSRQTGLNLYLKLENLQMTGSFKERGALNKIATLTKEQAQRGVVAASAGNHAQGVAYHATQRGIRSVIVMPLTTPLVKVQATRNFGAEVVLHGANYDAACDEATRRCEADGMTFIHPFDDPLVMAGQGTIGLELLEQIDNLEAVVIPIGGGGLIGGIACALKESRASSGKPIRVVGVQTSRLPSMAAALEAHHPVTLEPATTIADGIAVRRAGEVTYPVVAHYVDEIVTVDEDEIASAILTLLEREKTLAEGAGAAALAAILQRRTSLPPATRTAVIVGGGNIDVTLLSRIIERGLVQDGRLIRLRIHLLDRPGALTELTQIIAEHRANIVDTLYNRAYYGVNLGDTAIDITMETRGREQVEELLAALTAAGYKHSRVL